MTTDFKTALATHLGAISARDIATFGATISRDPEARVVGPDGAEIIGYEAIVAAHRDWFSSSAQWSFEPQIRLVRAAEHLSFALLEVDYREGGSRQRFLLSVIFLRENGAWKLWYDQNTPLSEGV